MTNSIINNLTKDDIISEIILTSNYPNYENRKYVVVEGSDDIKFMRRFLENDVEIVESYSGKEGVKEIVSHFKMKNIIGICDKDYEKNIIIDTQLFYYDYCNLEMMILSFDSVINNLISESKVFNGTAKALKKNMLDCLKPISYIRKYNYEKNSFLKLDGLISKEIFDERDKKINIKILKSKVLERNSNINESKLDEIISATDSCNLLDITNGHDATNLIHHFLEISHKEVMVGMRCAFNENVFKKTLLFNALKSYETSNNILFLNSF